MRQYSCSDCKYYKKVGWQADFGKCTVPVPLYVLTFDDADILKAWVANNSGQHDYGDDCDCFEHGE